MRGLLALAVGLGAVGIALALAAPARAQEAGGDPSIVGSAEYETGDAPVGDPGMMPGSLVLGAEVGGIFPQLFTSMNTHIAFGIEIGYRLPFADQRVEILLDAGYSPPWNDFTATRDEGDYNGELDQAELHFSLGGRFRLNPPTESWNINLGVGGRLFLLKSWSNGDRAGQPFAEFREQSTQVGFFVALGGEYNLGPGALFLDLDLGYSALPHKITGDVSTGNLTATLGYRFFIQ